MNGINLPAKKRVVILDDKKNWLIPLAVFIMVELAVLAGMFDRFEMSLYDSWFRLQGAKDPGGQVVIVAIDEASVQKLGPLAWPRSVHARLLEKLKEARVVGFDLVFDSESKPEEDESFARAMADHGRVVLASQFSFEKDEEGEAVQVFLGPVDALLGSTAGLGFVNTPTDNDGVVRHITAVDTNTFEIPFPSLGLAVAMVAQGVSPADLELVSGKLKAVDRVIPVDAINRAMPGFWGPQGTFSTYSYYSVLEEMPSSEFKDKIVMVGTNIAAMHDDYPTPYTTSNLVLSGGIATPGVEIHASFVQSFIEGRWYGRASPYINVLVLLLACIATSLLVAGRGPWMGVAAALCMAGAAAGAAYGLWSQYRLWLDLAAPLAVILLTYVVITASDFVRAEMGRRRTRAMFSRYVSPDVVDELMRDPDSLALGGRRQTLTVMFCDIRGFTAYSEKKAPEEVVARLNEYLTAMTGIIFKHGGTLDKYLGDGLMAIFGAPVYHPDHVQRAVMAAMEMQGEIERLNGLWAERNALPLKVGSGINSGSVLVGNVGSPERMDYTVIGEDVNLASRVEGLTKTYGTMIVVSERSVRMLEGKEDLSWRWRYLGASEVKGFTDPVGVYTVEA